MRRGSGSAAVTNTRSAERAAQRTVFGVSALLFVASAALTIIWCGSMAAMGGTPMPGGWTMSMAWMRMPGQTWLGAGTSFLGMWVVMMVAMMLPPLFPALAGLRHNRLVALAGAGYFLVWALWGAVVYAVGSAVARTELHWPAAARLVPLGAAAALLAAGAVQVSPWKVRQLALCRACCAPERGDSAAAWLYGVRFGANCTLCCVGLMAVLLVAGMMNIGVVAGVGVAIAAERLGPRPAFVARAIGAAIVATGVVLLARAL
jgi:predicted metal-binding membrane protein